MTNTEYEIFVQDQVVLSCENSFENRIGLGFVGLSGEAGNCGRKQCCWHYG